MFKWACLGVAVVFLTALVLMINDLRLEIRQATVTIHAAGQTVNEHLPSIVDKGRKTTDTLAENLPEIVEKLRTTSDTLAELAEDIGQLKELAGVANTVRDQNLVAYATSALNAIDASGGTIGQKKLLGGKGLKNQTPAKEWVVGARKRALLWTLLAKSKQDLLARMTKSWYIQIGEHEPVTMQDWLKANHEATKEL